MDIEADEIPGSWRGPSDGIAGCALMEDNAEPVTQRNASRHVRADVVALDPGVSRHTRKPDSKLGRAGNDVSGLRYRASDQVVVRIGADLYTLALALERRRAAGIGSDVVSLNGISAAPTDAELGRVARNDVSGPWRRSTDEVASFSLYLDPGGVP